MTIVVTNMDPLDVLKEDIDDVVDWASGLDALDQRSGALRQFVAVAVEPRNPKVIRIKALHAIRALPPHSSTVLPGLAWPEHVLQSVLTEVSRLCLNETDGELKDASEYARKTLLQHLGSANQLLKSFRLPSPPFQLAAASFDGSCVERIAKKAGG